MTKTSSSPPSVRSAKINHADDSSPPRASHFRTLRFRPRRDPAATRLCSVASSWGRKNRHCFGKPTKIDDPASL